MPKGKGNPANSAKKPARSVHILNAESSSGSKEYKISIDLIKSEVGKTTILWCSCPAWKFSKEDPKTCKHIAMAWTDILRAPENYLQGHDSLVCNKSISEIVGWNLDPFGNFLTPLIVKAPINLSKGRHFICPCGSIVIVKGVVGRCGCGKRLVA